MVTLVSVYYQCGVNLPSVDSLMRLCEECTFCKIRCTEAQISTEISENGHVYCDNLGGYLFSKEEKGDTSWKL